MNIDWKKAAVYSLVVLFTGLLIVRGIVPAWNTIHSDFANYYVSAKLVVEKVPLENLYDNAWFQKKIMEYGIDTPGKFSPFPPITAWLMIPFTSFEPLTAQRAFTLINLLFIALGIAAVKKLTSLTTPQSTLLVLSCGLGLTNNIAFGQVYLIMTVFILVSFILVEKKNLLLAGLLLGFFTAVKYFPIAIVAGFFLHGVSDVYQKEKSWKLVTTNSDFRIVFYSMSSLIGLLILQYFYFGKNVMNEFITVSFLPHLDGELKGQGLFSYQFQSWDNFFRNLFVYDEQFNPHPFINWSAGKAFFKIDIGLAVLIFTSVVLYRFRSLPQPIRRPVFLSLPALAALVFLPASATYHFILLISSIVLILHESHLDEKFRIGVLISYGLIGLIPYGWFFSLAKTYGLLFAYPRLWLISCLFILVIIGLIKKNRAQQL